MTQSTRDKISWIFNLLGDKTSIPKIVPDSSDRDSDYDDIMSNASSREDLVSTLALVPTSLFRPYLPMTSDYLSPTITTQSEVERCNLQTFVDTPDLDFNTDSHISFIMDSLYKQLPASYAVLDANHPWLIYWLTNSAALIKGYPNLSADTIALSAEKIKACIINDGLGGIGGGANQLGHVASTYAGVISLVLAKEYKIISEIKSNLYLWLMSLKLENGSFIMHANGESDTRSTYCALVVASLLGVVTSELTENTLSWLDKCQTYEGGFAGVCGTEAHGGYTFCALASYYILLEDISEFQSKSKINLNSLLRWCVSRQLCSEGGLSGRTNKLVDACYSFWIGAIYALLEPLVSKSSSSLFDSEALRHYILRCAQSPTGGFRDKPGKSVDAYHTNYTICGLSVCEYNYKLIHSNTCLAYRLDPTRSPLCNEQYTLPVNPVFGLPHNAVLDFKNNFDAGKML